MRKLLGLLTLGLLLSACAADGSLAKGKPVDKLQTIAATCDGIAKANIAFQAFARSAPGVIDANGMATEATILEAIGLHADPAQPATPGSACAQPYAGDLAAAENAVISAFINVTQLIATWKKT